MRLCICLLGMAALLALSLWLFRLWGEPAIALGTLLVLAGGTYFFHFFIDN